MDHPSLLRFHFFHIGDQITATSIPENVFLQTGERLVIEDSRIWAFKHNPFVTFGKQERYGRVLDVVPDCRLEQQASAYRSQTLNLASASQAEYMVLCLGVERQNIRLRHPRLYIYEDEPIVPHKVVVHTTGSDRTRDNEVAIRTGAGEDAVRVMSDEVIAAILKNYRDWKIVQVGGKDDKPLGGGCIDRRGQYDLWETAREIATASRFIGVNSGPMHIANCYPRVDKRVVLMEFPEATLQTYRPGDTRNWLFSWIDPSHTFFNKFAWDVGPTYSFRKI